MNALTTAQTGQVLEVFGALANEAASKAVFALYQERRPVNTQRSQRAAIAVFISFLRSCGIAPTGDLYADPLAWQGITWGTVQAFQLWLLQNGYSVKTVNDRVSAIKVYMGLANQAGYIPDGEILRLQSLRGYSRKEAVDADTKRKAQGIATRRGTKKSQAVTITDEQARALCQVLEDTPQARRDALLMCLLIFHGLRVSEAAVLTVEAVDLEKRMMTFYRPKTGKISRHRIRGRAWQCLTAYMSKDQPAQSGGLLLASNKSGVLLPGSDMSIEAIRQRVRQLGREVGLPNLSPHDLRHYGATVIANDPKSSLAALMAWGGWESASSAARYIEAGAADNDGVSLGVEG